MITCLNTKNQSTLPNKLTHMNLVKLDQKNRDEKVQKQVYVCILMSRMINIMRKYAENEQ